MHDNQTMRTLSKDELLSIGGGVPDSFSTTGSIGNWALQVWRSGHWSYETLLNVQQYGGKYATPKSPA